MQDDELRLLIRDAIARHLGRLGRSGRLVRAGSIGAPSRRDAPAVRARPVLENAPVARPLRVPGPDRTRRPVRGRTRRCAVTTAGSASRTATEGPAPQRHVDLTAPARLRLAPIVPGNTRPDRAACRHGRLRSERQPVARGTRRPDCGMCRAGRAGHRQGRRRVPRSAARPARGVQRGGRLQQHRRRGRARAQDRRHQHAGRAQRGLRGTDMGPHPRRHASPRRRRAHPPGRAVEGIPARFPARHGPGRQDARRDRHGAHRPGRRGQGRGIRDAHGVHEVAAPCRTNRSSAPTACRTRGCRSRR